MLGWFKGLNLVPATDTHGHVYRTPYGRTARCRTPKHTKAPELVRAPGPGGQTGPSLPYGGLAVDGLGVAAVAI